MQFRILGPVTVIDEAGTSLPLGPPRQHTLLAALLLHLGEPMPVDRLIGLLWDEDAAPPSAATIVHGSVAGLRRTLEPAGTRDGGRLLVTQASGYALRVAAEQVDAARFERLVAEGRSQLRDDPRRASGLLAQALSLWHGPALAGVDAPFAGGAVHRLGELRLEALEARAGADLALGMHADLVGELAELVNQHPLRERLWAKLMVALYQCGRQSDALPPTRRPAVCWTSNSASCRGRSWGVCSTRCCGITPHSTLLARPGRDRRCPARSASSWAGSGRAASSPSCSTPTGW
jgi:DNA-binding SARP family transcriptional activator